MIRIFTRPRKSLTHTTLQADGKSWREAREQLRLAGLAAYTVELDTYLKDAEDDKIVQVTLTNGAAQIILRTLGLSA